MFNTLKRLIRRLFNKTRTINNTSLNWVSLIVIVLIDVFILINVFNGLADISQWYVSPSQAYPCYFDWNGYQSNDQENKDYEIVRRSLSRQQTALDSVQQQYQQINQDHLGSVAQICMTYAEYEDQLNTPTNQQLLERIDQYSTEITTLEQTNQRIREQYDSTLLEQIAGQASAQSINDVEASQAKQELDQNTQTITQLNADVADLQTELVTTSVSVQWLSLLQDDVAFQRLQVAYDRANFWHPSIEIFLQFIFLCPLILIAFAIHAVALRKNYALVALISWHLLIIFFIPLIFKLFQFLQFGAIAQFIFDIITTLLGGLLFLVSYVYILLIPLLGFGIIKFFQRFVFNPRLQAANRIQNSRCLKCAKRIRNDDRYCPHCGYYQYGQCPTCHELTYKYLPYCHHCGAPQEWSSINKKAKI